MKTLLPLLLLTLAACSGQNLNKEADTAEKASTISLSRVNQRVIRYDCQGAVTSDRVEATRAPVQNVNIQPRLQENLFNSDFDNLTLNTKAGCIVGYTQFTVDYSYGWCNMRVGPGVNEIRYRFYYCDKKITHQDPNGNSYETCDGTPELREEGKTYINVFYEETNSNEVMEVRPTPESCQAQAPKK
ncbi:hypothetical protein [Bdellovibrio sp. HCB337]|uniref:hypothetical protein n=1 Tax=Bdellovibrio sp. HCB337 TaxID=3394358 RepID=UPI0039A4145B